MLKINLKNVCFAVLLTAFAAHVNADLRVDPPNWWVGMANHELELLIHGDNVGRAQLELVMTHDTVKVVDIKNADSDNYLIVNLLIAPEAMAQTLEFKLSGAVEQTLSYSLKARDSELGAGQGYDASDVLYLLTPDRFANGDSSNDRIEGMREQTVDRLAPYGRHGGDLQGVLEHLDYLRDLGVTQLWMNPVLENDQTEQSYHGYAITDHYRIDPRYGDLDLMMKLANEARARGIQFIWDVIPNHSGSYHWWMQDLPFQDWVNYPDSRQRTNHRRESVQDPYSVASDRENFQSGWFVDAMPDLNQRNAHMARYLIQSTIWWIETLGLSGLRVDTYSYSDKAFLTQWNAALLAEYPNLNSVGEEWSLNPTIVAYWQEGKHNSDGYLGSSPAMMDFPLNDSILKAVAESEAWNTGLTRVYQTLANDFVYANPNDLVIFPDNHDMSRVFSQVNESVAAAKMALTMIATLRGIPQIFYGTEILMHNRGTESHGVIRSDFPGGWAGDKANARTGVGLSDEQFDFQKWTRELLNWRRQQVALHKGDFRHKAPFDGLYAYSRTYQSSTVLVLVNNLDVSRSVPRTEVVELTGDSSLWVDAFDETTVDFSDAVVVPPKSVLILQNALEH
ncbi:MAG: glycoside hydrolase family 13 protein [Halieaceae bacterium]|nr:glycoside hydrolase family 13 protein [Halieaceae bacterium]